MVDALSVEVPGMIGMEVVVTLSVVEALPPVRSVWVLGTQILYVLALT